MCNTRNKMSFQPYDIPPTSCKSLDNTSCHYTCKTCIGGETPESKCTHCPPGLAF